MAVAGELVYFWIPVPDAERAKAFYGGLLGWEFARGNVPNAYQIANSQPAGGVQGGSEASSPQVCFSVDDIHAGVARVRELAGEAGEPQEIPSGFYAACRDDQGSRFYLWAPTPDAA